MKKNLFLYGDIGVGKSSLIREAVLPYLPRVGGLFVQRILIGNRPAAFKLNPVENAEEYRLIQTVTNLDGLNSLFLYSDTCGRWHQNPAVFNCYGASCLKKSLAGGKELILLDELGGIELYCPAFMDVVTEALDGDCPVLGVIKSPRNLEILESSLADNSRIGAHKLFFSRINDDARTELLHLTSTNRARISAQIQAFVEAAFR